VLTCGIAAEARTAGDAVAVQLRDQTVTAAVLPESVLHYALRTKEIVILDDASAQNPFAADPYICHHQARSILCVPLINQAKLIGVLYLENNLSSRAFMPARIAVLRLLASQAAISLENARLYRDLEEREAKIRRLVDANIIGIFIWDFEGQILQANEAFLNMMGHDHEDLVAGGIRWTDLTPPEWRDPDTRLIQEHKVAGTLQPFEREYLRKDGSRVPVLIGVATFGNQGVAFVLDLTERKRAEEALRRSEANLAEAQRLSHTGSWVFNPATREILYWSEECYRIWGFDPAQGLPNRETVCRRIHPGDRGRVLDEAEEALHQKRDYSIDFRIVLPDGTIKHVEAIGHHIFSASGNLVEVIGTHIDVTERKRAQEEHERLRQLESDLAHMNRLGIMGEQAASLSHEITQPIACARNNTRAAMNFLDRQPPELGEVREALACVVADADRAGQIIDRIRDHIRKAPPRKSRFGLNDAIDEVIVLGRSAITKNGVLVQTRLAEGLFPVQGDRVQLQQVILNLVLNAVEAMSGVEAGQRELLISTERTQGNGVLVAVRDSGPGVDPERVERVFEAFYTTKPSGLGMGLSICRTIIGTHGGRLWADANEPRGAVFQFTLPAAGESL
jgi:PAS domain S-box-containing protein